MFTYQMVNVEITQIFENANLLQKSAYKAMQAANNQSDEICSVSLADTKSKLKELQKQLKDLELKIEFIKGQS